MQRHDAYKRSLRREKIRHERDAGGDAEKGKGIGKESAVRAKKMRT